MHNTRFSITPAPASNDIEKDESLHTLGVTFSFPSQLHNHTITPVAAARVCYI